MPLKPQQVELQMRILPMKTISIAGHDQSNSLPLSRDPILWVSSVHPEVSRFNQCLTAPFTAVSRAFSSSGVRGKSEGRENLGINT
eukprot:1153037-Amorphochlora_amoeboformis.AAC.1